MFSFKKAILLFTLYLPFWSLQTDYSVHLITITHISSFLEISWLTISFISYCIFLYGYYFHKKIHFQQFGHGLWNFKGQSFDIQFTSILNVSTVGHPSPPEPLLSWSYHRGNDTNLLKAILLTVSFHKDPCCDLVLTVCMICKCIYNMFSLSGKKYVFIQFYSHTVPL